MKYFAQFLPSYGWIFCASWIYCKAKLTLPYKQKHQIMLRKFGYNPYFVKTIDLLHLISKSQISSKNYYLSKTMSCIETYNHHQNWVMKKDRQRLQKILLPLHNCLDIADSGWTSTSSWTCNCASAMTQEFKDRIFLLSHKDLICQLFKYDPVI